MSSDAVLSKFQKRVKRLEETILALTRRIKSKDWHINALKERIEVMQIVLERNGIDPKTLRKMQ